MGYYLHQCKVNIINKLTHFDNPSNNYSLLDPILLTNSISTFVCNTEDLGDEFHYLLKCNYFNGNRKTCIDKKKIFLKF